MKRWPLNTAYFWQQAPFFRLLIPLTAAIYAYDRGWLPAADYSRWLLGCGAVLILLVLFRKPFARYGLLLFMALQLSMFVLGCWCMQRDDIRRQADWFGHIRDTSGACLVRVLDVPAEKDRTWKMQVAVLQSIGPGAVRPACGHALLSIYKRDSARPARGDLLIPARWQRITNAGNPFEFDYAAYCRRKGCYHQQLAAPDEVLLYRHLEKADASFITRIHAYCQRSLDRYLKDTATRGLMQAMLLGDESSFDPALRQAYADTGVIHIVSISGSHVAVLLLIITSLLFWLKGRWGQWIKYGAGVSVIWLYVLMAGAPPSAVRAALMFSVIALGVIASRQPHPLNTLFAAAFILLVSHPAWLFAVGFQLSFCAVLSLLLFYRPLYQLWPSANRLFRWLWQALAASIAAEVLTAPLSIYYFHGFPLFFAPANLLAALLLGGIALTGGICVIAFSWLPPVAKAVAWGVTWLVRVFNLCMLQLQRWNPESFRYLQLSIAALLLFYLITALLGTAVLRQRRRAYLAALGCMVLFLALLCRDKYNSLHQEHLVAYNLGRHTRVELIRGNRYYALCSDTTARDGYVLRSAHTGFQAWQAAATGISGAFVCSGRHILQLRPDMAVPDSVQMPVDILLIERPLKGLSPSQLRAAFHPRQLVVAGGQPRSLLLRWQDSCARLRLPLHATGLQGAFVLQ